MSQPTCVIIGAGEGLGQALSAKFARQGFDIALISRTQQGSEPAMKSAAAANRNAAIQFFRADAARPETIERAIDVISNEMSGIEVLIYNPRVDFTSCSPVDVSYETLEEVYKIEVMGAFAAAKSVLPGMRERGRGSILFSSATAALRGSSTHMVYAIGKFGLRALSQSLSKAYAKEGVHVVHFRLDCDLDMPLMKKLYGDKYNPDNLADTHDVAETYWWAHQQPKSAWSNEIELRPYTENWTC